MNLQSKWKPLEENDMKTRSLIAPALAVWLALGAVACRQGPAETVAKPEPVQPTAMKMTTEIPASIEIPDEVETRLGTLRFEGGFPTEETAQSWISSGPWRA